MNGICSQDILGYTVYAGSLEQCVDSLIVQLTDRSRQFWLTCLNPHSYVTALRDRDFADALRDSDWIVPDGSGVVLASNLLGGAIRQRITGSDIFYSLNSRMDQLGGYSVFFLGSTPDCLAKIKDRMGKDYPKIRFAGSFSPPFKQAYSQEDLNCMIEAINSVRPDILWVGLTAPKQEKWIYENLPRLNVRFAAAVGAVFDFYSGRIVRSNSLFQRLGLEWLPRLLQEPRRLWKRMFISAPVFLWHVIKAATNKALKK